MGTVAGMRARSSELMSFMVVPEWIFRLATPLYSSTTADSILYHEPGAIVGAFAFAQATNRIAPESSAITPLCAIDGEAGAETETTFPSMVTHSPGTASAIFFCSVPAAALPGTAPRSHQGDVELFCQFIGHTSLSLGGLDTELVYEPRSLPSIFFGSTSDPFVMNLREILSAVSE